MTSPNLIRFASIPKCASRTLKANGLLGEVEPHSLVTTYPDWERFEWYEVTRDYETWVLSWWAECKRAPDAFTVALGFQFQDVTSDLHILTNPPRISGLPKLEGVNAWVPSDFSKGFDRYFGNLMGFCRSIITAGVPCIEIPIAGLDAWLSERGFVPAHLNRTEG